jgi:hypothetical protein
MKAKVQTIQDMVDVGATLTEAQNAMQLWKLLRPALKVGANGRVDTTEGNKTPLGFYRTIRSFIMERWGMVS